MAVLLVVGFVFEQKRGFVSEKYELYLNFAVRSMKIGVSYHIFGVTSFDFEDLRCTVILS